MIPEKPLYNAQFRRLRRVVSTWAALALSACVSGTPSFDGPPWMNPALDSDQRAQFVLAEMTLDEKISLLHGILARRFRADSPPLPGDAVPGAGYIPGNPRLGIPPLRETDAGIGVTNPAEVRAGDGATALPSVLAVAATWNPEIAYAGGAIVGSEARAKGFNVLLGGSANLVREPRNGRNFEYPGEDPLLGGVIAGEAIRGSQDQGIISTTKHYAINSQETGRHVLSANIEEAAFRESDLLLFEIALEIGDPGAVMCAYNRINGTYACENAFILNEVLKGDWEYPGWVLSDWGAVHSTVDAALNGLDQQSGEQLDAEIYFGAPLKVAVEAGLVTRARLDDMVHRILRTMFRSGVVDRPPTPGGASDFAANAAVTQRAAEEAIVLLRNERRLLPLSDRVGSVAVIGGHADQGVLSGGGSSQVWPVGGPAVAIPVDVPGVPRTFSQIVFHPSAPLEAIREALPGADVRFADGSDHRAAAALAAGADVAIVFATQWATEFVDLPGLHLPDDQDALIAAVAAANPRTVVVLETGGPVFMPWLEDVAAVLQAWYPGTRGAEAIANVLVGEVNPSGRLPVTFPRSLDQLPHPELPGSTLALGPRNSPLPFEVDYIEGADVGYRWFEKHGLAPLFAFGHGLSYTTFAYGGLAVSGGRELTVSFDLTNTGERMGAETAQVYVRPPQDREALRLAGWRKVQLSPGESRRVTVTVDPRLLAHFDTSNHQWRIEAGRYEVSVRRSVATIELSGGVRMNAQSFDP